MPDLSRGSLHESGDLSRMSRMSLAESTILGLHKDGPEAWMRDSPYVNAAHQSNTLTIIDL